MPAPFAALNAVLFDLDGTLIETHIDFPAMTAAMQELARAHFVPASVTDGKDILGMVDAAAEAIQERGGDGLALRRTAFAALEAMEIAGCAHPNLLPGTHELLSGLVNRGLKVGIVTRNCRAVSVRLLARFALPHHLLLTRDDVPKTKPNPEHLWEALECLGEPPGHAAMVGDHWMDIQAGVRAGCAATLGILGRNDAAWFASCPPSALARDLREAAPWLGG
jgi:phosphoglycolate phosphatase